MAIVRTLCKLTQRAVQAMLTEGLQHTPLLSLLLTERLPHKMSILHGSHVREKLTCGPSEQGMIGHFV